MTLYFPNKPIIKPKPTERKPQKTLFYKRKSLSLQQYIIKIAIKWTI
ncbi:hypothetical protein HMPREF0971_02999 [Segatella oris F0302]|uniref:Uncharacterized protein n=1 Tax=Segatella oris F0302 TaxID=649760 RepID=D1QV76_9BACT|nr:hypothetical protein HMPREF0971_02999 [Segatella oris F0302]